MKELVVPNKTETPRQYARRALYDLAHVLEHLDTENWDSMNERKALLAALETHAKVLRDLANHIEDGGNFDEDSADASDAFLATPQKTCVKCSTPVSERGIDADGGFHPGKKCREVIAASKAAPSGAVAYGNWQGGRPFSGKPKGGA